MPAGCNFSCKNNACEQYKKGFTITSSWPMGRIELIINSNKVKNNEELRNYLIDLKNKGEKLACIQLPDENDIPIVAYRVSLWSDGAKMIYNYPIDNLNTDEFAENLKKVAPEICEKTGCKLRDFNQITTDGIDCPCCKEKMQQNRWFTNEK